MGCTVELSISKASVTWGVSRTTIHKKIKAGQLSKLANGTIDTSEMIRVFGEPNLKVDSAQPVQVVNEVHPDKLLEQRIKHLETSLSESKEREAWLQSQVGNLTDTIKLLDAPKSKNSSTWRTPMLITIGVLIMAALVTAVVLGSMGYIQPHLR
jgi:hypothetical protein